MNFFNAMLPVRSLMTEICTCGENCNFPWKAWKGKSGPSDCFASGRVPGPCIHLTWNLWFLTVCGLDHEHELETVPLCVCDSVSGIMCVCVVLTLSL